MSIKIEVRKEQTPGRMRKVTEITRIKFATRNAEDNLEPDAQAAEQNAEDNS